MKRRIVKIIAGIACLSGILCSVPGIEASAYTEPYEGLEVDASGNFAYCHVPDYSEVFVVGKVAGEWHDSNYENGFGCYDYNYYLLEGTSDLLIDTDYSVSENGRILTLSMTITNEGTDNSEFIAIIGQDTGCSYYDEDIESYDSYEPANVVSTDRKMVCTPCNGYKVYAFSDDADFCLKALEYYSNESSGYIGYNLGNYDPREIAEPDFEITDSAYIGYWPVTTLAPGQSMVYHFSLLYVADDEDISEFLPEEDDGEADGEISGTVNTELSTVNIGTCTLNSWEDILRYMPGLNKEDLVAVNNANSDFLHVDMTKSTLSFVPEGVVTALGSSKAAGLHVFIGNGDSITFMKGYDYSNYKMMYFNHNDIVSSDSRIINFERHQSIGGTVVLHTSVGEAGKAATVYKVVDGQEVEIAKCISNADGQICFKITETAKYVVRY